MNKIIALTINDFRNIMRDNILKYFFLAVPLLFILLLTVVVPLLTEQFPVISDYNDIIVSCFSIEFPMIIGFVVSFIMLDEKDERVFIALRIMPVTLFQFLFYRLFFSVFFTFLFVFLMLFFNNLYSISIGYIILNSFLFALLTPLVILTEVTFASNKVTGFAVFKGLNFILMIPVASFFIPSQWSLITGIFPTYWSIHSIYSVLNNQPNITESIISIFYSILCIIFLSVIFKRRVYNI